jgi:hypothetical protein
MAHERARVRCDDVPRSATAQLLTHDGPWFLNQEPSASGCGLSGLAAQAALHRRHHLTLAETVCEAWQSPLDGWPPLSLPARTAPRSPEAVRQTGHTRSDRAPAAMSLLPRVPSDRARSMRERASTDPACGIWRKALQCSLVRITEKRALGYPQWRRLGRAPSPTSRESIRKPSPATAVPRISVGPTAEDALAGLHGSLGRFLLGSAGNPPKT